MAGTAAALLGGCSELDLDDASQLATPNNNIALSASVTPDGVLLEWDQVGAVPGDAYVLYRRLPDSTSWGDVLLRDALEAGRRSHLDERAEPGRYHYQVVAVRASGDFEVREAASNIVEVTVPDEGDATDSGG